MLAVVVVFTEPGREEAQVGLGPLFGGEEVADRGSSAGRWIEGGPVVADDDGG